MKNNFENEWDKDDEEGGTETGTSGKIHFRYRDAMSIAPRDDVLPPTEIKRLLQVHDSLHKARVDKQKLTRKERQALKTGQINPEMRQNLGLGAGAGGLSRFKRHPISDKAYFSGIDKQMVAVPTEFNAETNLEMQERLENQLQNRMRLTHAQRPKPRPAGF